MCEDENAKVEEALGKTNTLVPMTTASLSNHIYYEVTVIHFELQWELWPHALIVKKIEASVLICYCLVGLSFSPILFLSWTCLCIL